MCFLHLSKVKGFHCNHKRVYRVYQELELDLRIKPKKGLIREKHGFDLLSNELLGANGRHLLLIIPMNCSSDSEQGITVLAACI